jgi:predicted CXXCH cytochrome family protein
MQEHCERCHALSFDPRNPERTVPHGSSAKVTESLVEYYSAQYLRRYADSQRQAQPARLLRVPGVALGMAERERALRLARDEAELAARDLFERRSCGVCHAVSRSSRGEWQVAPVKINARWMPKASFSHAAHSTEVTPCVSCHAASQSTMAQDVLLPEIGVCRDCHGGDRSAKATQVPSTCVTCHEFHLEANTLWQPE